MMNFPPLGPARPVIPMSAPSAPSAPSTASSVTPPESSGVSVNADAGPSKLKPIRKTQRAPRRCETCSKRRIKCDGQIPCSFCTSRSIGHQCRRETVFVKGRLVLGGEAASPNTDLEKMSKEELWAQILSLNKEVEGLRKANNMEGVVKVEPSSGTPVLAGFAGMMLQEPNQGTGTGGPSQTGSLRSHLEYDSPRQPVHPPRTSVKNDLGKMAEKLGFIQPDHRAPDEIWENDAIDASMAYPDGLPMPHYELSRQLVNFALDDLGWLIAIVPMTFKDQHDHVWASQTTPTGPPMSLEVASLFRTKPCWTAMYLAVISCGLLYVRQDRASSWGIEARQKMHMARLWFRASVNIMLSGAAGLAKPTLQHVQTFCVLCLLTQPFDASTLHDTMLASMLQAGRLLGLHRRDTPVSTSSEIGKRCWGFLLCRESMYAGDEYVPTFCTTERRPFHTFLNISEASEPPSHDQPWTTPTRVVYLAAQTRLSAFVSDLKCLPPDPPYETILSFDHRLSTLLEDMPYFSSPTYVSKPTDPHWLGTARHVLAMSRQQKRLLLHRHYFALSATNERYARSRVLSVEAALRIAEERERNVFPFDDLLDTINHTLPAAIVLLLDAIYPVPSQRTTFALVIERCAAVERLLSPLRAATYRGSTAAVLKSLASVDELLRDTTRAAEAAQAAEQAELEQARQAKLSAIVAPPIDVYGPGGMMMGVGGTTAASGGDQTLGGMLHDLDFEFMLCSNDSSWPMDSFWTSSRV